MLLFVTTKEFEMYEISQVQTGCETVEKFCTGFMQDFLHRPSVCSVKQPVSDLMQPAGLGTILLAGEHSNPELLNGPLNINHEEACDALIKKSTPVSNPEPLLEGSPDLNHEEAHDILMQKETLFSQPEPLVERHPQLNPEEACDSVILKSTPTSNADLLLEGTPSINPEEACDALMQEPVPISVGVSLGEHSNQDPLIDGSSDINHEEACDTMIQKSTPTVVKVYPQNYPEKNGRDSENVLSKITCVTDCPIAYPLKLLLPVVPDKVVPSERVLPVCDLSADVIGSTHSCKSHETIALVESSRNGHEKLGEHALEASLPPKKIGSSDFDCEGSSKSSNLVEQSIEAVENFETVKLDDDCSDSEMLRNEISFISLQASKKKSYKKKLRDALTSRLQSAKKQEYEQIAMWYVDTEIKRRADGFTSTFTGLDSKRSPSHDSYEFDWVLL